MRFDFCGVGVDLIRAPYKTRMRLRSDSEEETEVQWFRCLPGAKVYPGYTLFGSGNWAIDRTQWNGPGEVLGAPRPFTPKHPPKLGLIGQGWCGSHKAIEEGATGDMPPLPLRSDGMAKCCPARIAPMGLTLAELRLKTGYSPAVLWNGSFAGPGGATSPIGFQGADPIWQVTNLGSWSGTWKLERLDYAWRLTFNDSVSGLFTFNELGAGAFRFNHPNVFQGIPPGSFQMNLYGVTFPFTIVLHH